jgi:hypothetical protein
MRRTLARVTAADPYVMMTVRNALVAAQALTKR